MISLKNIPDSKHWLIFTDLDGTLLDHESYNFDAAQSVLEKLHHLKVPVIINSSKTTAEISDIANDLNLNTPQIAENGSVIYYPEKCISQKLGADYQTICQILDEIRHQFSYEYEGFHDWSAEEIAAKTGLKIADAQNAAKRQASEPLLWQDDESSLDDFRHKLKKHALELKQGGRFLHVMGQTDKVKAMQLLQQEYEKKWGCCPFVIALGDSGNDIDMLAAADVAIIVKNTNSPNLQITTDKKTDKPQIIRTSLPGPTGWNEAMTLLLNTQQLK